MSDDDFHDGGTSRIDELAQRTVDSFMTLVRRGTALAGGTLAIVLVVCVGSFALGVAALSDGIQTVWIVLGGLSALVAIGAVVVAIWRLLLIRTLSVSLVKELHELISSDPKSERVVIETVESSDGVQDESAMVMSRQFFSMQQSVGPRAAKFVALGTALRSITTFPLLMLLATVITIGFAGLGLIFLLALAL